MNVSDKAVEAACWAVDPVDGPTEDMRRLLAAAIHAAMPEICETIAREVEADLHREDERCSECDAIRSIARSIRGPDGSAIL